MAKRAKILAASDDRLKLIEALKFASIASTNNENKTEYVSLSDHWLTAENDTFTVGCNVDVDLELCPHAAQFQAALTQCGQQFQLTQVDLNSISIKSGNFRAVVPALSRELFAPFDPDPACGLIDDRVRDGFAACLRAMGKGERIYHSSILLRSQTVCATNGGLAIEYYHGIDLPGPLNIPKKTAETIVKLGKPLAQFGFSHSSFTFYFNDMSFIKTRMVSGEWPNIDALFARSSGQQMPVWRGFFEGLKAIDAFVENDTIHFHAGCLASHGSLEIGANYQVEGLPQGYAFSGAYWRAIEPFAKVITIAPANTPFAFYGDNVRGLLIGRTV